MRTAVTTAKPPAAGSVAAPPTRAVVATRMIGAPLGNLAMDRFTGQSTAEAFIDKFGRAIGGRRHAEPSYSKGDGRDGRRGGLSHG